MSYNDHPVSDIQLEQLKVKWVPIGDVHPNTYNPNRMTPQMHVLLERSILEDGWTQPIVTLEDGTIVDGEQRWTVAQKPISIKRIEAIVGDIEKRKEAGATVSDSILDRLIKVKRHIIQVVASGETATLAALTDNQVPITVIPLADTAHQMISTIRHNRATGKHQIERMAAITQDLVALGLDFDDLNARLGIDKKEAQRLFDAADGMMKTLDKTLENYDFGKAWEMVPIVELPTEEIESLEEDEGTYFDADLKDSITKGTAGTVRKINLFLSDEECATLVDLTGDTDIGNGILLITRIVDAHKEEIDAWLGAS